MKNNGRSELATKLLLVLVFALGCGLVFMGWRGQAVYSDSGFSSEAAYQAIYALSGETSEAWDNRIRPELDRLSEADRAQVDAVALKLVAQLYDDASDAPDMEGAQTWRLLYAAWLVNGPKVPAAAKRQ